MPIAKSALHVELRSVLDGGGEVLLCAALPRARVTESRHDEFVTFSAVWSFVHGHACR